MKSKNEIPNKTEFMKLHSFHFIEGEKFHSELVHEKNVGKVGPLSVDGQRKEAKATRSDNTLESLATHHDLENKEGRTMSQTITLTESRTDFTGASPRRYTTTCFIKPVTTPVWYTESLLLHIDSNRRKYQEKVYFKEKFVPVNWSENMTTEVKTGPKCVYSDLSVPIDASDEFHYISLEPQQIAAKSTDL